MSVQALPEVLEWQFRAPAILEEILEADADIITLQELNHYGMHFKTYPNSSKIMARCLSLPSYA